MEKSTHNGKVNIFAPINVDESILKSEQEGDGKDWYVTGYATTADLDLQDDIVDPQGIDISHLLSHGYINYEHQQSPEYKIGEPTEKTYVDHSRGLYVEAKLYKDNPHASSIWNLAKNIQKAGGTRRLGYSIEGYAQERDKTDPRIIRKTFITNVALTSSPANPHATWEAFMKNYGFTTGHGITPETQHDASALRAESLARSLRNLSYSYANLTNNPDGFKKTWDAIAGHLDEEKHFSPEAAVMFLQLSKGVSRDEAVMQIDKIINSTKGKE
jgi:hypothetical protein